MLLNQYIIAIGVAFSFLIVSVNANECPANMNKVDARCLKIAGDFEKLTPAEQVDESDDSKKAKLTREFETACTASRAGILPNCAKLTPGQCTLENKCKMSGSKCTHRSVSDIAKLSAGECKSHEDEQGDYCANANVRESFGSCLCSKKGTGCVLDCGKLGSEAACATEPTACSWNGSECARN